MAINELKTLLKDIIECHKQNVELDSKNYLLYGSIYIKFNK